MQPIEIRPSRLKLFLLLAASFAFTAAGVGLFFLDHSRRRSSPWIPLITALFFGACALVFLWQLFESRPRLIIDEHGINDRSLGVGLIPWAEITGATLHSLNGNDFICLTLRNPQPWLSQLSPIKRAMSRANKALGFTEFAVNLAALPVDSQQVFELIVKECESRRTAGA